MQRVSHRLVSVFSVFLLSISLTSPAMSQGEPPTSQTIIIKREALQLIDHRDYQAALELQPIRSLTVKAPLSGIVRLVQLQPAQKVGSETPAIQLDNMEQQLALSRARLELAAAKLELDAAKAENAQTAIVQLHETRVEIADKAVELADLRLKQTTITVPFECVVSRILVTAGEYVREGDPLLTISDNSKLKVEVPMDRQQAKVGQTVTLNVEGKSVQGKITAVYPLGTRYEKLRELVASAVSAEVVVENGSRQWQTGQTVYCEIMPRNPVAEVANLALQNLTAQHPADHRKVQVIRDQLVRDLEVQVLAQVGSEKSYVTGPFQAGDELIVSSSLPLVDGTQVRPSTPPPVRPGTTPGVPPVTQPQPPKTGF